tara:strand:- start:698 stop:964 length:267 start_codon:yes stop_codon:yes gene_type:complete
MSQESVRATVKFKNGTQMDVPITPSLLKLGIHIVLDAMFQGNQELLEDWIKSSQEVIGVELGTGFESFKELDVGAQDVVDLDSIKYSK